MKHVKLAYKKWAEYYDKSSKFNPATEMEKGLIIPLLKPKKKDFILDIGCGTGRFTIPIAKKCKKVIAIDLSKEMLAVAKEKAQKRKIKNIDFRRLNAGRRLPFKNSYFDKVVCTLAVNHIKNLKKFIKEIYRILKKNGVFVYDDFCADIKFPFKTMFDDVLAKMHKKGLGVFTSHKIRKHVYSLHRAGFDIETVKFIRFDKKIKHTLSKSTYKRNKGRTLGVVFRAKKE